MSVLRFAAPLVLFAAACSSAWSYASVQPVPVVESNTLTPNQATASGPRNTAQPVDRPVLSIGVSDPNTQLILPRLLTDIINAVNSRVSANDFLRNVRHDM
ncbi:hypothetical protein SAMN05192563_1004153 [Paraburkholderia aspalathi]|uniref:Uncharacterized protein n=1 Tax=Paraburkholderia aspalathi TaxID=1324617 RepID=A0A1I7B3Q5_9BURK|nr:hypothetical protein SAMN05192563_1004153 [Paraburkholderia aspalathi]